MLLIIVSILFVIWTIDLVRRAYLYRHSVGDATLMFFFCIAATPLIAWLLIGKDYLYD